MKAIAIGSDPNAAGLKTAVMGLLEGMGRPCQDYGSDDTVYANVAIRVAEAVAAGTHDRGILICGTGIGMSIAANKVPGAYAALVADAYSAERARKSNNANIVTLGAFTTGVELAKVLVRIWLQAEYTPGGPSEPKVRRIVAYEERRDGG